MRSRPLFLTRPVIVALTATLLTSTLPPAQADASSWDDVDFVGSGFGHGVGLSQYGALAMATLGSDYVDILTHYYQGTSIGSITSETTLWVNLERDFSDLNLSVLDVGSAPGSDVNIATAFESISAVSGASVAISQLGAAGCSVEVINPEEGPIGLDAPDDCVIDFAWYQWDTGVNDPTTKIEIAGCTLADWNSTPTTQRPCQYARGTLHLRSGPGGLDLSAEMLMEDYVLGISEMPYYWEMDALKSQAVAARSYAEARRIVRGDPASNSCDGWCHVKDTTSDQRYVGWGHSNTSNWILATQSTASEVVTHPDSSIGVIAAYYSSSSGGATEFGHEKGFTSSPVEWLSSVNDSWAVDGTVWNPKASWTTTISAVQVAAALEWDSLTSVRVTQTRPGSGSAAELEFQGIKDGVPLIITKSGSWTRSTFGLFSEYFSVVYRLPGDEMFFYRDDGLFRYYNVSSDGSLGSPILAGSGYTAGWSSVTSVDLDGDGQDEMFFYRDDGLFRYYNVSSDGSLGSPILAGSGYTAGWSSVTSVDLDGDGQDEMFFYRDDGLFRYYNVGSDGSLGSPILAGSGYTAGWSSVTSVDLDGDGQDEMFFYRDDGLFRYYNVGSDGSLGSPILAGSGYTAGWSSVTSVDLDGDGQDEMFFYRDDGLFRYYNVGSDGSLGSPIAAGSNYAPDWSLVAAVNLDGF